MIKLNSLSRWRALEKGSVLKLPGEAFERRIRLEVNSPGRVALYIVNDDGETVFLASPIGRDVVEFGASGEVRITTTHDDVFVYSAEFEPTSVVVEDPEVFTQIAQRRARNPELEQMMFMVNQNMERRFAAQAAEYEEMLADLKEKADDGEVGIHVGAAAQHQELDEKAAGVTPPISNDGGNQPGTAGTLQPAQQPAGGSVSDLSKAGGAAS